MLTPCESILKRFLPSLKAGIACELYDHYDMNQVEIASKLGITQAAVSKYLSRDLPKAKEVAVVGSQLKRAAVRIAHDIVSENLTKEKLAMEVCEACMQLNDEYACIFQKAYARSHEG